MKNDDKQYETVGTCQPDYKNEYYRHIEIIKKLKDENAMLQRTVLGMCRCLFAERGDAE